MNLLDSFDYAMARIERVQQAVTDDRLAQALLDEASTPRKRRKR